MDNDNEQEKEQKKEKSLNEYVCRWATAPSRLPFTCVVSAYSKLTRGQAHDQLHR